MEINAVDAVSGDWTEDSDDWSNLDDSISIASDVSEASTGSIDSLSSEQSIVDYIADLDHPSLLGDELWVITLRILLHD